MVIIEKPYLLFGGDTYYPSGGFEDYIGSFKTLDEAIERVKNQNIDWWHIVSIATGSPVLVMTEDDGPENFTSQEILYKHEISRHVDAQLAKDLVQDCINNGILPPETLGHYQALQAGLSCPDGELCGCAYVYDADFEKIILRYEKGTR